MLEGMEQNDGGCVWGLSSSEHAMRLAATLSMLVCTGAIAGVATVEAYAASPFCADLQGQYAAVLRQSGAGRGNFDDLSRQLFQASAAAQRGNCNRFLFFGPPRSPACPAIMATIGRLQQQLAGARSQGFGLFASNPDFDRARLRDALVQNGCDLPASGGAGRTLCVRLCDGYYFPISNTASRSRYKIDAVVCQSMYADGGQAELYVQPSGSDVDQAVTPSGKRYADQPYAFQYQQSYDAACHSELKMGIAALAARYLNATPITKSGKIATSFSASEVPRTYGIVDVSPPEGTATAAAPTSEPAQPLQPLAPNRPVRLVGDAYYADVFDLSRPAKPIPERKRRLLSTVDAPGASASGGL